MNINSIASSPSIKDTMKITENLTKDIDFAETLQKAMDEKDDKKLKEACEQIETYMLTSLFKQMKESTKMGEELIPKGDYEQMFESQMIEKQCESMVKSGGIGLADMMYKQMSKNTVQPSKVDTGV